MGGIVKWLVKKADCSCHRGKWAARLAGCEYELFEFFELALSYAVDPRFRSQWKAWKDLARQYPKGVAA